MHVELLAHFNTLERRVLEDAMVALGILFSDTGEQELEAGVASRVRARRTTRETAHMPPSLRDAQAAFRGILQDGARFERLTWARDTLTALQQAIEERRNPGFWLPPGAARAAPGTPAVANPAAQAERMVEEMGRHGYNVGEALRLLDSVIARLQVAQSRLLDMSEDADDGSIAGLAGPAWPDDRAYLDE
jgi:hypothetical protein